MKVVPISARGNTLEGNESPGELRAHDGPNSHRGWWTLAWSNTLKAGEALRASHLARRRSWRTRSVRLLSSSGREDRASGPDVKRATAPETVVACVRGAKLWRVKPQERNRHETRPAGSERMKAPGG
jgi:hypothetical protein